VAQRVDVEEGGFTFEELRKLDECFYVNDFGIKSHEKLRKHIVSLLLPLGQLVSGGARDLLRWLTKKFRIPEDGFKTDARDYVYDNFYLYYGSKGSGTMLHFVSSTSLFVICLVRSFISSFIFAFTSLLFRQAC